VVVTARPEAAVVAERKEAGAILVLRTDQRRVQQDELGVIRHPSARPVTAL
jgi:hypothetical protein